MLRMPYFLALKAEALYFADRVSEALEAITEAEERSKDLKSAGVGNFVPKVDLTS